MNQNNWGDFRFRNRHEGGVKSEQSKESSGLVHATRAVAQQEQHFITASQDLSFKQTFGSQLGYWAIELPSFEDWIACLRT